jgi:pteridine reductase
VPLALVTGGAIRVGRAIALALGRAGYDVVVHANRSAQAAEALVAELGQLGRRGFVEWADLSSLEQVQGLGARVAKAHPALDLLVHSAAAYEHVDFAATTPAQVERMFAVNVRAPFFLTQALLPTLRAAPSPAIVTITDMAVERAYTSTHFFSHYIASKAALAQLTKAWALELGPAVRVNAVAPGPVAMAAETTDAQRADMLARIPLKREGSPEDIAQAVLYLARAPYVTGQALVVDGGLSVS